ncbi:MAG: phosphoribosylformylglycinamidine synthase subunit PurS [Myxococcota bacterium]
MRARVIVMPKEGVLDPQGKAIEGSLHALGYDTVSDVRAGKCFMVEFGDVPAEKARAALDEMSEKLLANPLIESWKIELETA